MTYPIAITLLAVFEAAGLLVALVAWLDERQKRRAAEDSLTTSRDQAFANGLRADAAEQENLAHRRRNADWDRSSREVAS
jgi:high-affinity Fe2+/Pb2+ permease